MAYLYKKTPSKIFFSMVLTLWGLGLWGIRVVGFLGIRGAFIFL